MSGKIWQGIGIAIGIMTLLVSTSAPLTAGLESDRKAGERLCLDCHGRSNINTNEGVLTSRLFAKHAIPIRIAKESLMENRYP